MAGEIADIFTVSNSVDLDKMKRMQQVQMKMAELRERRDDIIKSTGKEPLGYFAYERLYPTRVERTKNGVLGGAALGGLLGGVFGGMLLHKNINNGALAGVAVGAGIGAIVGAHTNEQEESRMMRSMLKYEAYLTSIELSAQASFVAKLATPSQTHAQLIEGQISADPSTLTR